MANTYTYEATAERKEWSKQVKVVRLGERGFCIMCLLFFMRKVQNGDATKKLQKDIFIPKHKKKGEWQQCTNYTLQNTVWTYVHIS